MSISIRERLESHGLDTSGTPAFQRERLAVYIETKFDDKLSAWEVRTGRHWREMSKAEAQAMCREHPEMARNPGVLSRLCSEDGES